MVRTLNITTTVSPNHEMLITLPADVPTGPAEIVVVVASRLEAKTRTFGDLLRSEFFGMWKDRNDVGDSVEFALNLRARAWARAA